LQLSTRPILISLLVLLGAYFSFGLRTQLNVWGNNVEFWRQNVRLHDRARGDVGEMLHGNLARALLREGDTDGAFQAMRGGVAKRATGSEDTTYGGRYALGTIYYDLGHSFKEGGEMSYGVEAYRESLSCNPSYVKSLVNLGNAFVEMGKTDEAMVYLRRATEVEGGGDAQVWYSLGNCWVRMGEREKGVEAFKMALDRVEKDARGRAMIERTIQKFS